MATGNHWFTMVSATMVVWTVGLTMVGATMVFWNVELTMVGATMVVLESGLTMVGATMVVLESGLGALLESGLGAGNTFSVQYRYLFQYSSEETEVITCDD